MREDGAMGNRGRVAVAIAALMLAVGLTTTSHAQTQMDSDFGHLVLSGSHSASIVWRVTKPTVVNDTIFNKEHFSQGTLKSKGSYVGMLIRDRKGASLWGFVRPNSWSGFEHFLFPMAMPLSENYEIKLRPGDYTVTLLTDGPAEVSIPLSERSLGSTHLRPTKRIEVHTADADMSSLPGSPLTPLGSAEERLTVGDSAIVSYAVWGYWEYTQSGVMSESGQLTFSGSYPGGSRRSTMQPAAFKRDIHLPAVDGSSEQAYTTLYRTGEFRPGVYVLSDDVVAPVPATKLRVFAISIS